MVFLAAVWLVVSAVPIGYIGAGRYDVFWGDTVVGIAVAIVTMVRLLRPTRPWPGSPPGSPAGC